MSTIDAHRLQQKAWTRRAASILFYMACHFLYAQNDKECSCPPVNTCFACSGGITYLKLQYTENGIVLSASAADNTGAVPSTYNNGILTVTSRTANQPFDGDLTVTITKLLGNDDVQVFNTLCPSPIYVNDTIRHFAVLEGASVAGPLCCKESKMDKKAPVFTSACPANVKVAASNGCTASATWTPPVASDNCGHVTLKGTSNPGDVFPIGITTVTYTATDDYNNSKTCSFTVEVKDQTDPVITNCPANISISTTTACNATVTWTAPTATDNCGVSSWVSNRTPGSSFAVGATTVTYTATDAAGNSTSCSFIVTVTDKTNPVFTTCTTDIIVNATQNCSTTVNWTAPIATDNCSAVTMTSSHQPGTVFQTGTTSVIYTAKDASGNTATCSFKVTVTDKEAPVISNCPSNIRITANASCTAIVNWNAPTAKDNCNGLTFVSSHKSGSTFAAGTTHIVYTATDAGGNISTCQFDVIVEEATAATLTNCPTNIEAEADETGKAIVNWTAPSVISTCGSASATSTHSPGDVFQIGETEVIYSLPGQSGDNSSCRFKVKVNASAIAFDVVQLVSPNGDGINDVWVLPQIERFKDNQVVLLDRWGGLVYEASGYNNENIAWTGSNTQGVNVPQGTYFYTITVRYRSQEVRRKGFIELVR